MNIFIPIYEPFISDEEFDLVMDCMKSNWISSKGKYVDMFEKEFSDYTKIKFSTTVVNGTLALDLALSTLGISNNDEVIIPSLGYIAAASSIHRSGAKIVFADVNLNTLQICKESVKEKITSKTKAIIGIHNYGIPYDSLSINNLCKEFNIFHIEDCAEALGSRLSNGQHVGNLSDISTFSFYGNKTVTAGEGGMICTNSKSINEKARHLKNHAISPIKRYWHDDFGSNYRMTNIACAIGISQLRKIEKILALKMKLFKFYEKLTPKGFYALKPINSDIIASNWMNTYITEDKNLSKDLQDFLTLHKIENRPLFYPVHKMPMFAKENFCLVNSEKLEGCGLNLPSYPHLINQPEKLNYIKEKLSEFEKCI